MPSPRLIDILLRQIIEPDEYPFLHYVRQFSLYINNEDFTTVTNIIETSIDCYRNKIFYVT